MTVHDSYNAAVQRLLCSACTASQLYLATWCQNFSSGWVFCLFAFRWGFFLSVFVLTHLGNITLLLLLSFTLKLKSKSQETCSCSNLSTLTWALKLNNHIPNHRLLVVSRLRGNELLFHNYLRDNSHLLNHQNHILAHPHFFWGISHSIACLGTSSVLLQKEVSERCMIVNCNYHQTY